MIKIPILNKKKLEVYKSENNVVKLQKKENQNPCLIFLKHLRFLFVGNSDENGVKTVAIIAKRKSIAVTNNDSIIAAKNKDITVNKQSQLEKKKLPCSIERIFESPNVWVEVCKNFSKTQKDNYKKELGLPSCFLRTESTKQEVELEYCEYEENVKRAAWDTYSYLSQILSLFCYVDFKKKENKTKTSENYEIMFHSCGQEDMLKKIKIILSRFLGLENVRYKKLHALSVKTKEKFNIKNDHYDSKTIENHKNEDDIQAPKKIIKTFEESITKDMRGIKNNYYASRSYSKGEPFLYCMNREESIKRMSSFRKISIVDKRTPLCVNNNETQTLFYMGGENIDVKENSTNEENPMDKENQVIKQMHHNISGSKECLDSKDEKKTCVKKQDSFFTPPGTLIVNPEFLIKNRNLNTCMKIKIYENGRVGIDVYEIISEASNKTNTHKNNCLNESKKRKYNEEFETEECSLWEDEHLSMVNKGECNFVCPIIMQIGNVNNKHSREDLHPLFFVIGNTVSKKHLPLSISKKVDRIKVKTTHENKIDSGSKNKVNSKTDSLLKNNFYSNDCPKNVWINDYISPNTFSHGLQTLSHLHLIFYIEKMVEYWLIKNEKKRKIISSMVKKRNSSHIIQNVSKKRKQSSNNITVKNNVNRETNKGDRDDRLTKWFVGINKGIEGLKKSYSVNQDESVKKIANLSNLIRVANNIRNEEWKKLIEKELK